MRRSEQKDDERRRRTRYNTSPLKLSATHYAVAREKFRAQYETPRGDTYEERCERAYLDHHFDSTYDAIFAKMKDSWEAIKDAFLGSKRA